MTALVLVRPLAAQCPDDSEPPCRPRVVHLSHSLIAILPFRTVGSSLQDYGEGLVDLLSMNLNGTGGLTTMPPQRVIDRAAGQRGGDPVMAAAISSWRSPSVGISAPERP